MFLSDNIEGIGILRSEIPSELQSWHKFGRIIEAHFAHDIDEFGQDISNLDLLLSDADKRYFIKMHLYNVRGKLSFDTHNGFASGLDIEDLSSTGCEKENRFHIFSLEMDSDHDLYGEKISVILS